MLTLPPWIDSEAWVGFCEMRKAIPKCPFTPRAQLMIVGELDKIRRAGHCPNAALDQSTRMGWRDVWPAKEKDIQRTAQVESQAVLNQMNQDRIASQSESSKAARELAMKALKVVR